MLKKSLLGILLGVLASPMLWAQGGGVPKKVLQEILSDKVTAKAVRSVREAANAAAFGSVGVPSISLGLEALRVHPSAVGMGDYPRQAARFNTLSAIVPSKSLLSVLQDHHFITKPVQGYITSATQLKGFSVTKEAEKLRLVYGKDTKMSGRFLSTFEELRSLSFVAVKDSRDIFSALAAAFLQSVEKQTGFLTLAVEGSALRPKDVLVWNPQTQNWISLNKSKAAVLKTDYRHMKDAFKEENVYWAMLMEEQGVVVRPDNYDNPSSVFISTDGLNWQRFGLDSPAGAELWKAWNESLYIAYDRHARRARFGLSKESPLFSSVDNVYMWVSAQQAGIEMSESFDGRAVLKLSAQDAPNVWMFREDGALEDIPGAFLTVGQDFPVNPVEFMGQLRAMSAGLKHPADKLIFLQKKAESGKFDSVRDCVEEIPFGGLIAP